MKIIRPENANEFKKEEKIIVSPSSLIDGTRYAEKSEELIDDNTKLFIDGKEVTSFNDGAIMEMDFEPSLEDDNFVEIKIGTPVPIEQLMNETIDENKIKVEITFTKRQKELFDKKGGEKWLKKVLVGQKHNDKTFKRTSKRKI